MKSVSLIHDYQNLEFLSSMFKSYLSEIFQVPAHSVEMCGAFVNKIQVSKGQFLLRQGEICDNTFFVESGLLRMYSIDKNGKEHIIQFAPENWLISDRSSLYFNEQSSYFIDAIEDSEIVLLKQDFFINLTKIHPEISINNNLLLHNHIRHLQRRVNLLLGATAEERYLDFMKMYPNVFRRAPQWMIASFLGITPESLSRVRKELSKKNFGENLP
jgi:CRP-like cAMP-binding protein